MPRIQRITDVTQDERAERYIAGPFRPSVPTPMRFNNARLQFDNTGLGDETKSK